MTKQFVIGIAIPLQFLIVVSLIGCKHLHPADPHEPLFDVSTPNLEPFRRAALAGAPDQATTHLEFLNNQRLALAMNFSSPADLTAGQQSQATVVSTAMVTIFDAHTGNVVNSKSWEGFRGEPSIGGKLVILPVGGGDFIAGIHNTLFRFSPDFKIQAERSFVPIDAEASDGLRDVWAIYADVRGRSAMLRQFTPQRTEQNFWISPLTLTDEKSLPPTTRYVHLGSLLVGNALVSNMIPDENVMIEGKGTQPHALCSECAGAGVASGFGGNLLLLAIKPGASYLVVDTTGNVILRQSHSGSRVGFVTASGAAEANKVAIYYADGGVPGGGSLHFAVVDVDAKKEIWKYEEQMVLSKFEVGSFHVVQFAGPKIALSPDGHIFAILLNGVLRAYYIP